MNKMLLRLVLKLAPPSYSVGMLRKALANDDLRTVKEVIRVHPGFVDCISAVRRFGDHSRTPLYLAVRANDAEALRAFIDAGANPNTRVNNSTALEWAAVYGRSTEFARLLLSAGTDDRAAGSAVLESASHGNWKMALFLLSKKAGTGATDSRGWTALHHAAERGNKEVVECLLSRGAEVDAGSTEVLTIIDPASQSKTDVSRGTTALRLAEWHQRTEPWSSIARMLRDRGGTSRGSITIRS